MYSKILRLNICLTIYSIHSHKSPPFVKLTYSVKSLSCWLSWRIAIGSRHVQWLFGDHWLTDVLEGMLYLLELPLIGLQSLLDALSLVESAESC